MSTLPCERALASCHVPVNVRVCFGDEVADLMCLYVVRISRVDTQLGPAVRLTAVDRQQHDAELLVAHPAHRRHSVYSSKLAATPGQPWS